MRNNIERYFMALAPILAMERNGVITHAEFLKAEDFLAKKYYLNKHNIYRLNDLINSSKRVIYILPQEEVQNDTKNDNDKRTVTQVGKAD